MRLVDKVKNILIIVDLQKQFADKGKEKYNKCLKFIEDNEKKYDTVTATYFRQTEDNTNYTEHLGWNGCSDATSKDLEFETQNKTVLCKNNYGTFDYDFIRFNFKAEKDDNIDIIGCDSDACVLALCFSLWDNGYTNFHVLTDYIYTTSKDFDNDTIIKIMKRNFGDCIK